VAQRAPLRGVYTSRTAVCAAQMGINLWQSSGTVPLGADAASTIFPSGTGAVINQNVDLISYGEISASGVWVEQQIQKDLRCHWLSLAWHLSISACRISLHSLDHRPLDGHFEQFLCGTRAVVAGVNSALPNPISFQ